MFEEFKNRLGRDSETRKCLEQVEKDEKELLEMAAKSSVSDKIYIYLSLLLGRTKLCWMIYKREIMLVIYAIMTLIIIYNISRIF